jgi:hypothetical protein
VNAKIRELGEIGIALSYWQGAATDKKAGANLKRLVDLFQDIDKVVAFEKWFEGKGLHPDVNMPRVRTGNVGSVEKGAIDELLPAVEIPVDLYVEDLLDFGEPAGAAGGALPVKITITFGLTSAAVARKIPQVRALLIAWDVGWTIGSFIRDLPPVQRATDRATSWLADWANYKDIEVRFDGLFDFAYEMTRSGAAAPMELTVVNVKGPLFAAEEWTRKHGFQMLFRAGRRPSFQTWKQERERREQEALDEIAAGIPTGRYSWSPGHAMLMAYALGSEGWTADQISRQLDDDCDRKLLHPMQKDLLGFYLIPYDERTFAADYERRNAAFLSTHEAAFAQARDALAEAASGKRSLPAGDVLLTRWYELVAKPGHRDHVACMLYQAKDPERANEIHLVKAPDGWRWEALRARANEMLRVAFLQAGGGRSIEVLKVDRRRDALLAHCEIHHVTGLLSILADQLKRLRAPERIEGRERVGTYLLVEVQGQNDSQSGLFFVELDETGQVVDAIERH